MSVMQPLRRAASALALRPVCLRSAPQLQLQLRIPAATARSLPQLPPRTSLFRPCVRFSSSSADQPNKTQLYDLHVARGAKMVPFAGFSMPLWYSDLDHAQSHSWTRTKASLFDVSHMVQHELSGPGALALLMKITPSSIDKLKPNTSTLSCLLDDASGGILDDCVITRRGAESFYFVTNAGRRAEDLAFLKAEIDAYRSANGADSIKWDILEDHALVALQGPLAASALQSYVSSHGVSAADTDLSTLYFGQCRSLHLTLRDGSPTPHPLLISRTGYTGEDGFEISIPTAGAASLPLEVTELLLSKPEEVRIAGLAARDSLRLEAGMCLYGHDITTAQTPSTAGLSWIVGKDRRDLSSPSAGFNGASVILPQVASPAKTLKERRVGFTVESGPPAREGAVIVDTSDEKRTPIGIITSGMPSPSLGGTNIAMGYIKQGMHKKGTEVGILVRNRMRKATVAEMPFVKSNFYRPK